MSKDTLYFDLLDACAETGCPVCRLSLKSVQRYLDNVMYEYVSDPGMRADLRAARGYCNDHGWWLTRIHGHSLGIAITYHDVVNALLDAMESIPAGRSARQRAQELLKRLRPAAECPACAHRRTMEDLALGALLRHVEDEGLTAALVRSDGLCLPHFLRALELVRDNNALARLVDLQRRTMGELHADLAEFMRKSDHRFRDEGFGKEGDSWLRAVGIVCGREGVR